MGGIRKTQKIVFYEEEGNVDTRYLKIPKVINSDISFQLMFGFHYPFEKVNNYIGKDPYHGIPEHLL